MDKKYLIIIGGVVGLIILGLIFFLIFRPAVTGVKPSGGGAFPQGGEKIPAGQLPGGALTQPAPTVIQPGQQKPLTQLTQKAVSGATFINGVVRYFEKATGNIYNIGPDGSNLQRISNITIPNIFEVYWAPNGEQTVLRYTENNETGIEDVVRNFSITSVTATSTHGIFLSSALKTIAPSPKENKIFYLMPFDDTNIGVVASFEDKKQKQVLAIPFGEWVSAWPAERVITLLMKPAANVNGYLYSLDPVTGSFAKILGNIPGLTALLSPDGERIVYSQTGYDGLRTGFYGIKEKKMADFFGLAAFPEKCVWSKLKKGAIYCAIPSDIPQGKYPDDWYQGSVSFTDKIWRIDTANGTTEIISSESSSEADFINLFLSKNEDYLFLQNKKDGTLWSLRLI